MNVLRRLRDWWHGPTRLDEAMRQRYELGLKHGLEAGRCMEREAEQRGYVRALSDMAGVTAVPIARQSKRIH